MKKNKIFLPLIVIVILGLGAAGYYQFGPQAKNRTVVANAPERVVNQDLGISFSFTSGPTAYGFFASTPDQIDDPDLLQAYVMLEADRQKNFLENFTGAKTPPTISVLVFQLPDNARQIEGTDERMSSRELMEKWLKEHEGYSNFNESVALAEVEMDGRQALTYVTEDIYPQTVYISRYRDKMYLFTGQYEEVGDGLQTEFAGVVESVFFE